MKGAKRVIVIRGQLILGPFGDTEADNKIRSIRRRYGALGLKPPPMTTTLVHSKEWLDSWLDEDIHRQANRALEEGTP